MSKEKCDECKFWEYDDTNGYRINIGQCLRYPPSLDMQRLKSYEYDAEEVKLLGPVVFYRFPMTAEGEWCGEFKARTAPATNESTT